MKKTAIVGIEGNGKTVMTAAIEHFVGQAIMQPKSIP